MSRKTFMLGVMLGMASLSTAETVAPWDLLPSSGEITGWSVIAGSGSQCASAQVTSPESLFVVINGGAPVFTRRGYVNGVFEGFENGSNTACIAIFNQGSQDSAMSLYGYRGSNVADSMIIEIPGATTTRRNLASSVDAYDMVVGQYLVALHTQREPVCSTAAIGILTVVARNVTSTLVDLPSMGRSQVRQGPNSTLHVVLPQGKRIRAAGLFDIQGRPCSRSRIGKAVPEVLILQEQ